MVTLDISIVNVALPVIQQDLQASMADLQWIIDAYALMLSALILSAGILSDRYGSALAVILVLFFLFRSRVALKIAPSFLACVS